MMDNFEALVGTLDYVLNSKSRRHIVGGIFLSVAALFGGLAITAMTISKEENENGKGNYTARDF